MQIIVHLSSLELVDRPHCAKMRGEKGRKSGSSEIDAVPSLSLFRFLRDVWANFLCKKISAKSASGPKMQFGDDQILHLTACRQDAAKIVLFPFCFRARDSNFLDECLIYRPAVYRYSKANNQSFCTSTGESQPR